MHGIECGFWTSVDIEGEKRMNGREKCRDLSNEKSGIKGNGDV